MSRKAITIEDRVREFCAANSPESINRIISICEDALFFRGLRPDLLPKPKRQRKPKEAPQARLAGIGDGQ